MADEMLAETLRDRLPRLFAAGVDYNDVQMLLARITRIADWPGEWERLARERETHGLAAMEAGRHVSAGAAFQAAALYYHFAQFVLFDDLARKRRLQQLQADAHRRAARWLSPPAEEIAIPFEGIHFQGNLRIPQGAPGPAPCVLLNPGADSTKEEFHTLENEFLRRGLATFSYDGPGQGLTWDAMKLRPDFERPIAAVIDRIARHPAIAPERIGIWGRSLGAYCALRGATDPRLRACVSIGGFYAMGPAWPRMPRGTTESLGHAFGARDPDEAAALAAHYTLEGVLGAVSCPVLIVHSGQDNVCPVEDSHRMAAELGGKADLAIFAEGNHVCDNIPYRVRPLMADWLAEKLGAPPRAQ
ncbi:alpha/beta hydrolase family protein [Alkalilacustris brevis]|uniref:alpha/beta hydrolase family protein n=1 Tax=Alkalilacustris brevis TaxID=2026338 RepID=UPI000E0DF155|nr:alpha/beta hydrolase [Alkalilacustris brevis]